MDHNSPLSLMEDSAAELNGAPNAAQLVAFGGGGPKLSQPYSAAQYYFCPYMHSATGRRGTAQTPAADGQLRVPISRRWRCATRGQAANPALMEPGDKNNRCVCVCVCWMRTRSKNRGGRLLL